MNIQLQNVTYTYAGKYQRVTAVDGVSYTFHDGTLYTIMGASGSGKSTLLSLLAGLKLPTEGEITLDEQPIRLMDRSALRRDTVSVIYQDFNLFPLLTAEENVCYPLRLQKMDKEKALELARQRLTDMGIRESYFRKLPNQLSGGEQQRVAIARALAAGSRENLADAPTLSEIGDYENVEVPVWRGEAAPAAMSDAAEAFRTEALQKVSETQAWNDEYLVPNQLNSQYMNSTDATAYVSEYEADYMATICLSGF